MLGFGFGFGYIGVNVFLVVFRGEVLRVLEVFICTRELFFFWVFLVNYDNSSG